MICSTCRAALRLQRSTLRLPPSPRTLLPRHSSATAVRPRLFTTSLSLRSAAPEPAPELPSMSDAESAIADLLRDALAPTELLVQDISGGCGSMYAIDITSASFKGQSILKQQRMVNAALGDVIKGWHGVQIRTKAPSDA